MTTRSLRINYICPLPSLAGGVKSTRLICEAMVRRGHTVSVVYANQPGELPSIWKPRAFLHVAKKRIRNSLRPREHHLQSSTANLVPVSASVVRSEDAPNADVTIASWWQCVEWIARWPASKGVKVHYIRGHEIFHGQNERIVAIYRSSIPKLTNSHWLRGIVQSEYGGDAVVVHNGIDWTQFGSSSRPRNRPPVVGFMYGTNAVKGAAIAMRACREVQARIPDLRVVSFGSPDLEPDVQPPANFTYYPRPPQDEIAGIYRRADCWLIPSLSEGLPMPGLEAAACRCPLVASDCGGVRDFVREGRNGFLVPVGDSHAMAERIHQMLTMPEAQWSGMSEAGYEIAKEFDWDKSAEILETFLLDLLRRQPVDAR